MTKPEYNDTQCAIDLMRLCLQDIYTTLQGDGDEMSIDYMCQYIEATLGQAKKLLAAKQ